MNPNLLEMQNQPERIHTGSQQIQIYATNKFQNQDITCLTSSLSKYWLQYILKHNWSCKQIADIGLTSSITLEGDLKSNQMIPKINKEYRTN